MTESTMYWLTRLDAVNNLFHSLGLLAFVTLFITFATYVITGLIKSCSARWNHDDHVDPDWQAADNCQKTARPVMIYALILTIAISLVRVFIPTTREMAAIKVVPVIASPENCQKLKAMNSGILDVAAEWLKDIKENKKEKKN